MPTYCYTAPDGSVHTWSGPVARRPSTIRVFTRRGAAVKASYDFAATHRGFQHAADTWRDFASEALAVHPSQIKEAAALAKNQGFDLHWDKLGRPHFGSRKQFKDYGEANGYFNRDAGYGDAQCDKPTHCDMSAIEAERQPTPPDRAADDRAMRAVTERMRKLGLPT